MVYDQKLMEWGLGWALLGIIPMALALLLSFYWAETRRLEANGLSFCRGLLVVNSLTYYLLNFAFFHFPKPLLYPGDWMSMERWTSRSPNHIVFTLCLLGLIGGALLVRSEKEPNPAPPSNS
jgi:hypothetical protein